MRISETLRTTYRVSDFLSWQRAKTLVLSPSFQRRPVWKPGAKSYLVDTVVRGLPIPIIFLRDQKSDISSTEPRREVVDGQQRLRTLIAYIDQSLLPDFETKRDLFTVLRVHNPGLAGKSFNDLPIEAKQQILDYQFSVHVLPLGIDDREVLQIFARMNSTGVKLNSQELRNANWNGEFKTSMYELATEQLPRWRDWKIFTEDNIARMEEVELTSEFALLTIRGVTGKSQPAIDRIYRDKEEEFLERQEIEQRFRIVMDTIEGTLGDNIKFTPFQRKTVFYSLFASMYHMRYGIDSPLMATKAKPVERAVVSRIKQCGERIQDKSAPQEILESVARRTTHASSRSHLIKYLLAIY